RNGSYPGRNSLRRIRARMAERGRSGRPAPPGDARNLGAPPDRRGAAPRSGGLGRGLKPPKPRRIAQRLVQKLIDRFFGRLLAWVSVAGPEPLAGPQVPA